MTVTELHPRVMPSGEERLLGAEDLIVSKTDLRGHMTYVNHTFVEMSGYAESELIGRPHSLIRHPDMPRAVFRLLWDTLAQGEEIFAYVVNLAADGAHYWVLAHVTPSFDASHNVVGYHSNRRAPARSAIERVTPIYQRLRAVEERQPNARLSADAGSAELTGLLASLGTDYERFVWSLIDEGALS